MLGTILLIILIVLLLGAIPTWPYSRSWGYAPSGVLGVLLAVVIVLVLTGNLSVNCRETARSDGGALKIDVDTD